MIGSIIGDSTDVTAATTAQLAAFWGELAKRFKTNEKVIFGLMNEVCMYLDFFGGNEADFSKPHDRETNLIPANGQAAINAIRAAGANQLYVPSQFPNQIVAVSLIVFSRQAMAIQVVIPGLKAELEIPQHLAP